MPRNDGGRPATGRPATTDIPTASVPPSTVPDAWHRQAEWEIEVAWRLGYAQGRADADADLVAAMAAALAGNSRAAAGNWSAAVEAHHRTLAARTRRAAADRPGPRPGDYPGRRAA